ncbi:MAG: TadE/TadG family type IV pilus assembly protein [Eubacterium sp.]
MPFSMPAGYKLKKDCVSLQVHKSEKFPEKNKIPQYCGWKRVCLFTSGNCKEKGSITIEALIALIMFMAVVFFIGSFMVMVNTEMAMQISINNIVRDTAKNMFYVNVADEISENNKNIINIKKQLENTLKGNGSGTNINEVVQEQFNKGYLLTQLVKNIKQEAFNNTYIFSGVNGIDITDSRIEDGIVDLVIRYKMKIPLVNKYLTIYQRGLVKDWTGTDITKTYETVYITENGQVYHKSKNCSHLVIHISKTIMSQVKKLRNSSGGKYYECEYCASKKLLPDTGVFITEDGTRYHSSLQCSGLTRRIMEVDISQIGNKKPCSECGQGG